MQTIDMTEYNKVVPSRPLHQGSSIADVTDLGTFEESDKSPIKDSDIIS